MTTFQDLPQHIQEYIHGFNPEHRASLHRVHKELIRNYEFTHTCDYEYCERIIPIGEEIKKTFIFIPIIIGNRNHLFSVTKTVVQQECTG